MPQTVGNTFNDRGVALEGGQSKGHGWRNASLTRSRLLPIGQNWEKKKTFGVTGAINWV